MPDRYLEPAKSLPARRFDVVVAGGGTGGVIAALAAARQGASTALVEMKGYTGGIAVEGGTALHSFYNLWTAFPGVEKRQVVRGIPQEVIDRLWEAGGTTGHAPMVAGFDYDAVCTAIDTEIYKRVTLQMLEEAGVHLCLNTMVTDAILDSGGSTVRGVITESHQGREALMGGAFVDATGYGDLCARAGADYTEPNDYPVVNSIGLANVSVEGYHAFIAEHDALTQLARGRRSGVDDQIVRLDGRRTAMPAAFNEAAAEIGMSMVTTTVHDDYFMFIKINYKMDVSPTNRDAASKAEVELRRRQARAVELFRAYVPGCEKAFIARTSPSLTIRRGRLITCDYDLTRADILEGRHFEDDVLAYGFHDSAPRLQIKDGGTYGIPYRALRVAGLDNLLATGMMITSDHDAHMSTRNTVACMGQGQAAGTAAALCALRDESTRALPYGVLQAALERDGVYFEA
ncbi:MAG: FAD-dependent oxidoreductase [Anaerolineae bacterium]